MNKQRGFTLVEVVLVMALFVFMTGFITINLLNAQRNTSISVAILTLTSDLRAQQLKAMEGDTGGRGTPDAYGIHFDTTSYTLFHGTYNQNASDNFVVTLDNSLQFTTTNVTINFARVSGEIGSPVSITLKDAANGSSSTKIVQINSYGVVTQVN